MADETGRGMMSALILLATLIFNAALGNAIHEKRSELHPVFNELGPAPYSNDDGYIELQDIPLGTPDEEKYVPVEPLTSEDFANAKKFELLVPVMNENSPDPIQSTGLFEGDIVRDFNIPARNAITELGMLWPGGVVSYVLSAEYSSSERSVIAAAFQEYKDNTCIRFTPRTTQKDYVHLYKGEGCNSHVGRNGGRQLVSLGFNCIHKPVIIHELMHAIGFWHEHNRPDRDDYVTIFEQNITPGMEYWFQKYSWDMVQSLGVSYDTSSVMHYPSLAFSKDGRSPTILPKIAGVQFNGQRIGFSKSDIKKINMLYKCGDTPETTIKPTTPTTPLPEGDCNDNNNHCSHWARIGECTKNPNWMLVNCKKSCEQCSEGCINYNQYCDNWAGTGQCNTHASYMTIYCAKSCKLCTNKNSIRPSSCYDSNEHCMAWAAGGQCVINPNYMLRYCRKSCQQC